MPHLASVAVGERMTDAALRHDLLYWVGLADGWQLLAAMFIPPDLPTTLRLDLYEPRTKRRQVRRYILRERVHNEARWQRVR